MRGELPDPEGISSAPPHLEHATLSAASGGSGIPFRSPLLKWPLRGHRRSYSRWHSRRRRRGARSYAPEREHPTLLASPPTRLSTHHMIVAPPTRLHTYPSA